MVFMLDIIGSTIAASLVILTLIQFNYVTADQRNEFQSNTVVHSGLKEISEVIEFDFYKAGFRVDHPDVFLVANDTTIIFLADLFNNGSVDTVLYSIGNVSQSSFTENPNDKPIFRKVNNGTSSIIGIVKDFKMIYIDSTRTSIPSSDLTTSAQRRNIRAISLYLIYESIWKNNDYYQAAEWKKTIFPKNL